MTGPGGGLRIVEVDPTDDAAVEAWHTAYAAAERHGREATAACWQLAETRVMLRDPGSRRWAVAYAGLGSDGLGAGGPGGHEVVCTGYAEGSVLDNLDLAEVAVGTVPAHRRRGHGSAILAHLEAVARARGRTRLIAESSWALEDPSGADSPGARFLTALGFDLGLGDVQRELRLPVPDGLLDRLAADAAPHHPAYTLRSWVGPVPEELLQGWAELTSSLLTEAPLGELEREPETADPALVRQGEARLAAMGRSRHCTVALDAAGEVAAYTDIGTTVHEPGRGYQWGTLVRRADRGHRLGLAVKVENLRRLREREPDLTRVTTWNAEVNALMIGVNERLGFVATERLGEFQKRLA